MKQEINKKKGKTDYVATQYLGSVGKVDNGIVSVNVYGSSVLSVLKLDIIVTF
jgi:SRSO17 transposase